MSSKLIKRPPKERKTIYLKPHSWDYRTPDKEKRDYSCFEVRCWGVDKENNPTVVRIRYDLSIWIDLPEKKYEFDEAGAKRIFDRLCEYFLNNGGRSAVPFTYVYHPVLRPLYSAYLRQFKGLQLKFDTYYGYINALWKLRYPIPVWSGETMQFNVYNLKVEPELALVLDAKVDFVSWIEFKADILQDGYKITRLKHEYLIELKDLRKVPDDVCKDWVFPKYKSFSIDGEMNSERATSMPKVTNDEDVVICIGVRITERDGSVKLHMFNCKKESDPIPGVTIHFFESEEDMLKAYADFTAKEQPDFIFTHNGMGWDEEYFYNRLDQFLIKWPNDSRLREHTPILEKKDWDSSAYNNMRFHYITRPGVIHVDLLPWSKRTFRLETYRLDALGKLYLGKGKLTGNENKHKADEAEMGEQIDEDHMEAHDIFDAWNKGTKKGIARIGTYCVGTIGPDGKEIHGDVGIVDELMIKFQTLLSIIQMAKVAFVQPAEVYMKGQQLRTFNQVTRTAFNRGILMTKENPIRIPVKGAHVFPPIRGIHRYVFVFDFKGLYPSIIRRYNLCLTTAVPKKCDAIWESKFEEIPDDKVHRFTWTERWYMKDLEEWHSGKKKTTKKKDRTGEEKVYIRHDYKILKEPRGIFPENLDKLAEERAAACKIRDSYPKGSFQYNLNDKDQDAKKVCMNSAYGGLGADKGKLPNHRLAAIVTRMARKSAKMMANFFRTKYDATIVYGDSVTGDTPILCLINGKLGYRRIDDLGEEWEDDPHDNGKEISIPSNRTKVWSEKGFTTIKKVIRHKCNKPLKRVLTHTGCVDVTTDHSLLTPDAMKIKPSQVKVGDALLHADLPLIGNIDNFDVEKLFNNNNILEINDKITAARIYIILTSMGYSITIDNEENVYKLIYNKENIQNRDQIIKVIDLPDRTDYVYDLETRNHHFSAGVGRMVVHNTDSAFVKFGDAYEEEYTKDPWAWGKRMAKECTELFEKPQELEFEKVFETILLTNKKQYSGTLIPDRDKVTGLYPPVKTGINDLMTRGYMFIKRGNASALQEVQKTLVYMAVMRKTKEEAKTYVNDFVKKLLTFGVPEKELQVTQKIGEGYKSKSHPLHKYREHLIRKGKSVNAGDRFPYLFVKNARNEITGEYNPKPPSNIMTGGYSEAIANAIHKPKKAAAKKKISTLLETKDEENKEDIETLDEGVRIKKLDKPVAKIEQDFTIKEKTKKERKPVVRKKPPARKRIPAKPKDSQGDKMEHPELRKTNRQIIDYSYYLEKKLIKPVDTIMKYGFGVDDYMKTFVKELKQHEKVITQLVLIKNEDMEKDGPEEDFVELDKEQKKERKKVKVVKADKSMKQFTKELKKKRKKFGEEDDDVSECVKEHLERIKDMTFKSKEEPKDVDSDDEEENEEDNGLEIYNEDEEERKDSNKEEEEEGLEVYDPEEEIEGEATLDDGEVSDNEEEEKDTRSDTEEDKKNKKNRKKDKDEDSDTD